MSYNIRFFLLLSLSLLLMPITYGKRMAPKEVSPVVYNGVIYSAPSFIKKDNKFIKGQYIVAKAADTGKILWDLRVYEVRYREDLESDVQDVFITELKIDKGYLLVTNERGEKFKVALKSKKVTRLENNSDKSE